MTSKKAVLSSLSCIAPSEVVVPEFEWSWCARKFSQKERLKVRLYRLSRLHMGVQTWNFLWQCIAIFKWYICCGLKSNFSNIMRKQLHQEVSFVCACCKTPHSCLKSQNKSVKDHHHHIANVDTLCSWPDLGQAWASACRGPSCHFVLFAGGGNL